MPQDEIDQHKESNKDCIRCGRNGHKARHCRAFKTIKGTDLPKYPGWKPKPDERPKSAATKRKHDDDDDDDDNDSDDKPAEKRTATATRQPMWAENSEDEMSESDF